ncbi:MAG: cystathionine beta-lyase [Rhizobiaceae bacterium]|nr:cystathionine beta-lyase [Rhizobiaceae bacterium]
MSTKEDNTGQSRGLGINTRLAHIGNNPRDFYGYVNPPVVRASTILYPDYVTMRDHAQKYNYGIGGTPTTQALMDALTELESAAGTILYPSGLAAISVPVMAFAEAGMHILVLDSLYSPTREFCDLVITKLGIEIEYFSPDIGEGFAELMRPNTGIVMLEAPGSNSFEMCDIPLLSEIAHQHNENCVVMMDNTWATPLYFKPLDHGVDISIHALTKYPSGHADILMGGVSANAKHFPRLRKASRAMGMCVGGDDAYLVLRGLRTMAVRLRHHEKSTMQICKWLQDHDQVSRVLYPALPEHPGHELWKRDFKGASGLFSFVIPDKTPDQCGEFLNALQIFGLGYSWAGYESLAVMAGFSDRKICLGPDEGTTIRIQVGVEDVEDLIEDLSRGFAAVAKT